MTVSHTLATLTFVFHDSYTLWQHPLRFRQQLHVGNVPLRFRRQVHTLATSTVDSNNSYTLWHLPPSFAMTVTHFGRRTVVFDDSYSKHFGDVHLRFPRQLHTLAPSPFVFDDNYTLATSTVDFDDKYTLWQLPPLQVAIFRRFLNGFDT